MKTIRWGIIGCGNVTEIKSGPGFQKANNSTLVAVMRRDGALASGDKENIARSGESNAGFALGGASESGGFT